MNLRHFATALGLAVPAACAPAATATRAARTDTTADHSAPAEHQTSAGPAANPSPAGPADPTTTTEAPTTTVTITVPTDPPTTTTIRPRPLPTTTQPENVDNDQTDAEWWASQPGACGGVLPPCWVMQRESGGNIHAVNPTTGAAGKWQFLPSTSAAMGYPLPMNNYDEATQDAAAERLWNGGRGCAHWSAC